MDVLKEMDKVVGSVLDVLKDEDILRNTIVVFASDNGGINTSFKFGHFSNRFLRGQKGSIHEGGHRIPLMIRWDDGPIPSGQKKPYLVGLNDLFTTLCDLVEIEVPDGQAVDSVSFAGRLIENKPNGPRLYLGTWRYIGSDHTHSALRKGPMKLIYSHKNKSTELYDLSKDLWEKRDISKKYPKLVEEMKAHLRRIGPCFDRSGRFRSNFVSCLWFRKNKKRCDMNYDAQIRCGKTCAISPLACETVVE